MADGYIQTYPDSTGKKIDTAELTVNAQTVERQRTVVGDNTANNYLSVVSTVGTQGTGFASVQRTIDAGRSYWSWSWDAVAGVVSEALVSGIANLGGTNAGSATSYTVSSGKKLRLTSISVDLTGTAAGNVKLMLRSAPSAFSITSPLFYRCQLGITATTAFDHKEHQFPEGTELAATTIFGISQIATVTTVNTTVTINGYEYS